MVFYFIFLGLLLVLWLLFVYNLNLTIMFSLDSLNIKIFKIPFIRLKGDKFKKFLVKFVPTSTKQMQEEIDLSNLLSLIHYDVIELKLVISVTDYSRLVLINGFVSLIHSVLLNVIDDYVSKYTYLVEKGKDNNLEGIIKCNFNIGVILFNYLIIKGRYRYEKTNK